MAALRLTLPAAAAALALAPPAHAERWTVDAGIASSLTWSSNGDLGIGSGSRADTVLDVRPRITVRGDGARLRVNGTASLDAIATARGTQPNRILPALDLNARAELVQRFFFLEAGARAQQTTVNPFGAYDASAGSTNKLTTLQTSVAPSIVKDFDASTRLRARSDNSWTRDVAATAALDALSSNGAGYFGRHAVAVEHDPRPLGWRLEAERNETRYRSGTQAPLTSDIARASLDHALGPDAAVGLRVGREHTQLITLDQRSNVYGWQARWQPTPRTTLAAFEEHRFFGNAWRLSFEHRMPRLAFRLSSERTLDTTPQSVFTLPASDNVAGLLDAIFTTRYPDPAERAKVVADFMAARGIAGSTLQPLPLYAQRASISTNHAASVMFLGQRNTLTLSGFSARTEDAPDPALTALGTPTINNTQLGAALAASHRLSSTMTLNAGAEWSRIRALFASDRTTQYAVHVQLSAQLSPRTTGFAAVRMRDLKSNVTPEGREGAIVIGLDHRL